MFEGLCKAIHKEMDALDDKYEKGTQLSGKDLEDAFKMSMTLKNIASYEEKLMRLTGNSEHGAEDGSYARSRSRVTGRYVSMDGDRGNGIPYDYRRY